MDSNAVNKKTYSSAKIVAEYLKDEGLQKPEHAIFDIVKSNLSKMRMLDIGVGAGRTSECFINKVKTYTGIDYSEGMINACRKRFPVNNTVSFEVMDMSTGLKKFSNNAFDFVLISFNSIDYIGYNERMTVIKEIRRILIPGGLFCFSAHNINFIKNADPLAIKDLATPFGLVRKMYIKSVSISNRQKLKEVDIPYVIINDGAHKFKLKTLYINTLHQLQDLEKTGFKGIRIFNNQGIEIVKPKEIEENNEPFHYYLCTNTKTS
jgi:ubiquinone/menaquinone biosynthesis C-methylase UbiE